MTVKKLITIVKEDHPVDIVRYLERYFDTNEIKWLFDNFIICSEPTSDGGSKLVFNERNAQDFLSKDLPIKSTSNDSLGSIFDIFADGKNVKEIKASNLKFEDNDFTKALSSIFKDPNTTIKYVDSNIKPETTNTVEAVNDDGYIVRLKDELIEVQLFVDNLKCRYKKLKKFIEENDKYNSLTFYQKSNMEAQRDFMKKSLKFLKKYLEVLRYRTLDTVPNFD